MIVCMSDQTAGPGAGTFPPPPPPPYSPPPPPPPPYGSQYGGPQYGGPQPRPPRRLRRSLTNRRIAGVAGGLGDYLGVDATALRVGFVLASLLFLGGIGGPLLYVAAWIFVPEEGRAAAHVPNPFSGPAWQDWRRDRTARSWALVLGAVVLAMFWSFGFWPWWHWRALPALLALTGVALWALTRPRCNVREPGQGLREPGQGQGPTQGPGPASYTPGPAGSPGPTGSSPGPADSPSSADRPAPMGTGGPMGTADPISAAGATGPAGATGLIGATGPEEADWAEARLTAAQWAQSQLAAAGVSPAPPPAAAQPPQTRRRAARRGIWVFVAFFLGFLLCAVIAAVSVTLGSGSSLRGGVGANGFTPATASAVTKQYHLGIGNLDVNLSAVRFPAQGQKVDISVGLGHLTVEVPDDAVVNVNAHAGVGEVDVFGNSGRQVQLKSVPQGAGSGGTAPNLTLDAHIGVGYVQVTRG